MKRILSTFIILIILLLPVWAGATDRFAVWTGGATSGECPVGTPCTLDYAVETVAISGDTVKLNDGTYTIGQLVVPVGVNLVSSVGAGHAVIIRPSASMTISDPFILLASVAGTNGNQTISYLEIDGINGANIARIGIGVKSRDNVRIHHCNIHDFYGSPASAGVEIRSVEVEPTGDWWDYWVDDPQAPGTDTNLDAVWPANPVESFQLDNNTIDDCGYREDGGVGDKTSGGGASLWHLKNSTIHDNTFDNSTSGGQAITGRGSKTALLWNVDIYNNTFTMNVSLASDVHKWMIETWVHRGGCEVYGNSGHGWYSVTYGKETSIYNNSLSYPTAEEVQNLGIEFNTQSYGSVYQNYLENSFQGIVIGNGAYSNTGNYITTDTTVKNNILKNIKDRAIRLECMGANMAAKSATVSNVHIYNNTIEGTGDRGHYGIELRQGDNVGTCACSNVGVKNNIIEGFTNQVAYAGRTDGTFSSVTIDRNHFYNNDNDDWLNGTDTNTLTSDPDLAANYVPNVGSPAIDSGTNPGAAYTGGMVDTVTYDTDFTATPPNIYTASQLDHGDDPWFERGAFIYWDPIGGDPPPIGGWRKCALVIDETKVPDDAGITGHTFFPVLFDNSNLPAEMIDTDLYCAGGNVDFAFFSDVDLTAQIDHEKITTTCHATPGSAIVQIWVEVPEVLDAADTTIYIKYKNQVYGTDYGDYGDVWNGGGRNDYKAVWHLDEASGNALDASQYAENLTETAGTIASATGQIENGRDFERDDTEYFIIADGSDVDISGADQSITIEAWINPESFANWNYVIGKSKAANYQYQLILGVAPLAKGIISNDGTAYNTATGATAPGTAAWQHYAMVYNDTDIRIYRNGALDAGADNPKAHTTGIYNSTSSFMMGAAVDVSPQEFFDGVLDEVRISNTARSADWILTTYNSQYSPSTFVTEGAPEDVGAASPTITGIGIWNNTTSVCDITPTLAVTAEDTDVYICYELSEQIITVSNPAASEATTDIGTFTWVKQAQDTGDGKWSLVYYRKSVIGDRDLDDQSALITKNDAIFQDGETPPNDLVLAGSAGDIGDVSYAVPSIFTIGTDCDYPLWSDGSNGFHDILYDVDGDYIIILSMEDDIVTSESYLTLRGTGGSSSITGSLTHDIGSDNNVVRCLTFSGGVTDNGEDNKYQQDCYGSVIE